MVMMQTIMVHVAFIIQEMEIYNWNGPTFMFATFCKG